MKKILLITCVLAMAAATASATSTTAAASFLAPANWADNYGTRMFGWVHAPVTGDYTFYLHADDNAEHRQERPQRIDAYRLQRELEGFAEHQPVCAARPSD